MKQRIAFAAIGLLLSGHATAQEANPTGLALLFGVGPTTIEDEDGPGETFDGSDTGWNLEMEFRIHEYFAFGFNRTSFGQDTDLFNGTDTTIEVDGSGYFVRGYLPVTPRLTLSARYGETFYDADLEPGGGSFLFDAAKDYGIAADVYFTDHLALRAEGRLLDGDNQEAGSIATMGLRWQF